MIKLKNITKIYKKNKKSIIALNNINISFESGKLYAIMGCSGSGKSTMLNIIGLLDKPTSGLLEIDEINISTLNEKEMNKIRLKKIGYVFQECYLSDNLTVYENTIVPLLINRNIQKNQKNKIVLDLLKTIGLQNRSNHFPKELSGGEKQRVAIARALVNNPQIILADEPTGNLDKENEKFIFSLLHKLAKENKCVIIISHSPLIKKYADQVFYMKNGTLRGDNNDI